MKLLQCCIQLCRNCLRAVNVNNCTLFKFKCSYMRCMISQWLYSIAKKLKILKLILVCIAPFYWSLNAGRFLGSMYQATSRKLPFLAKNSRHIAPPHTVMSLFQMCGFVWIKKKKIYNVLIWHHYKGHQCQRPFGSTSRVKLCFACVICSLIYSIYNHLISRVNIQDWVMRVDHLNAIN